MSQEISPLKISQPAPKSQRTLRPSRRFVVFVVILCVSLAQLATSNLIRIKTSSIGTFSMTIVRIAFCAESHFNRFHVGDCGHVRCRSRFLEPAIVTFKTMRRKNTNSAKTPTHDAEIRRIIVFDRYHRPFNDPDARKTESCPALIFRGNSTQHSFLTVRVGVPSEGIPLDAPPLAHNTTRHTNSDKYLMNIESDRYFRQHIPVVELVDAVVDTGGRVFSRSRPCPSQILTRQIIDGAITRSASNKWRRCCPA
jgi:hypothetical protein